MEMDIFKMITDQGLVAGLFVWLLYSTEKKSGEREERLHAILEKFSEKYDIVIERLESLENKLGGK
jgi:hypothetical protein